MLSDKDSGNGYLDHLDAIAAEDAAGLKKAQQSYGDSWKKRGGAGAFFVFARKWDRLENQLKKTELVVPVKGVASNEVVVARVSAYDIFQHVFTDPRAEGVIDDIRDLRRYLMLVEAECRARGLDATHRDNK